MCSCEITFRKHFISFHPDHRWPLNSPEGKIYICFSKVDFFPSCTLNMIGFPFSLEALCFKKYNIFYKIFFLLFCEYQLLKWQGYCTWGTILFPSLISSQTLFEDIEDLNALWGLQLSKPLIGISILAYWWSFLSFSNTTSLVYNCLLPVTVNPV